MADSGSLSTLVGSLQIVFRLAFLSNSTVYASTLASEVQIILWEGLLLELSGPLSFWVVTTVAHPSL